MWTCPRCGHQFYNKSQSHSCDGYKVDDFLKGKSAHSIDLFNTFLEEYRKIGPFELHPVKTRIALLNKMRFCAINKIGADYISIHLVLTQPFEHTLCFYKIENLADRFYIHHARLYDHEDFTAELHYFMVLAYEVGNRGHIRHKNDSAG